MRSSACPGLQVEGETSRNQVTITPITNRRTDGVVIAIVSHIGGTGRSLLVDSEERAKLTIGN